MPAGAPPKKKRTGLIVTLVVLVVVLLALAGAGIWLVLKNAKVLDTTKLETQIAAELTTRIGDTITVDCPADQPVETGYTFECVASDSSGTKRVVVITEDDDQGNVTWELTDREP
ncbi:MAG: DUF4333 domain-containing protein [Candidatus Nanopelagicales bacterium]